MRLSTDPYQGPSRPVDRGWLAWPTRGVIVAALTCVLAAIYALPAEASTWTPEIRSWPSRPPPLPFVRPLWWGLAAVIGGALWRLRTNAPVQSVLGWTLLASILTRAVIPLRSIHTQYDDYRFVAKTYDLANYDLRHQLTVTGAFDELIRVSALISGESLQSAFGPAQVCGILLPSLICIAAYRWYGSVRVAGVAAALAVVSPTLLTLSGSLEAYLPAATFFAGALAVSLPPAGREWCNAPWRIGLSAGLLLLAGLMKPECLLLLPAHAVLCLSADGRGDETAENRWVRALPAALAAFVCVGYFGDYVGTFVVAGSGRVEVAREDGWWSSVVYATAGFLLLNPPFHPVKWYFLRGLGRPTSLHLVALALASIFLLSRQSIGFNHWRHAVLFEVPFLLAVAPVVAARRSRALWGLIVASSLVALVAWAIYVQPRVSSKWASDIDTRSRTLVVYSSGDGDYDAEALLALRGGWDVVHARALFPPQCTFSRAITRLYWFGWSDAFSLLPRPGIDGRPILDVLVRIDALPSWSDPWIAAEPDQLVLSIGWDAAACSEGLESAARALEDYEQVLLFVDRYAATGDRPGIMLDMPQAQYLKRLLFLGLLPDDVPELDRAELIEIVQVRDPVSGTVVWSGQP